MKGAADINNPKALGGLVRVQMAVGAVWRFEKVGLMSIVDGPIWGGILLTFLARF